MRRRWSYGNATLGLNGFVTRLISGQDVRIDREPSPDVTIMAKEKKSKQKETDDRQRRIAISIQREKKKRKKKKKDVLYDSIGH